MRYLIVCGYAKEPLRGAFENMRDRGINTHTHIIIMYTQLLYFE